MERIVYSYQGMLSFSQARTIKSHSYTTVNPWHNYAVAYSVMSHSLSQKTYCPAGGNKANYVR